MNTDVSQSRTLAWSHAQDPNSPGSGLGYMIPSLKAEAVRSDLVASLDPNRALSGTATDESAGEVEATVLALAPTNGVARIVGVVLEPDSICRQDSSQDVLGSAWPVTAATRSFVCESAMDP